MKQKKEKWKIFKLYLWKKIRDSKIRTKLYLYLVLSVLIIGGAIGGASYYQMRSQLLHNAEDTVISFLKHAGNRLDEQMKAFQMSAYSFSADSEVQAVAKDSTEKSKWERTLEKNTVSAALSQYGTLYQYSDFVVMQKNNGELIWNDETISQEEAEMLIREGEHVLKDSQSVKWCQIGGKNCFVRRIIDTGGESRWKQKGFLVIGVKDTLFEVGEESSAYTKNDNLAIAGQDGSVYKESTVQPDNWEIRDYLEYKNGNYYVYAMHEKFEEHSYLIVPLKTMEMRMYLVCIIPYHLILDSLSHVVQFIAVVTLLLCGLGLVGARILYASMKKNLVIIENGMQAYEAGDYSRLQSPACYDELGLLILQFNHMGMEIKRLNELSQKEEQEKQELKYQILETQINPHFLYNTLETIKWMAYEKEEEEIARLSGAIIRLLRFTVKNVNKMIPLKEELAYIRDYVTIQKIRYEDAFQVEYEVTPEAEAFYITCFVLQPFVENSILHGMDISKNTGKISIRAFVEENVLNVTVKDNGIGMSQEVLQSLKDKISNNRLEEYKGFNGVGVTNIILRMKMTYGEAFSYEFQSEEGRGTAVILKIPKGDRADETGFNR